MLQCDNERPRRGGRAVDRLSDDAERVLGERREIAFLVRRRRR